MTSTRFIMTGPRNGEYKVIDRATGNLVEIFDNEFEAGTFRDRCNEGDAILNAEHDAIVKTIKKMMRA